MDPDTPPLGDPPVRPDDMDLEGARPRVAVLPFLNRTGDPERHYFCEGLAAEIFLGLARVPGVTVVARSSVAALGHETPSPLEAGRKLGAACVLHGYVRRADDRLQIDVGLLEVESGRPLWSERFDRPDEEVFSVLDEIITAVVLAEKDTEAGHIQKVQQIHTNDLLAYDFYLRGRQLYYLYSRPSVEEALGMFERAIEIDADYALAWCGLADCYSYLHLYVDGRLGYCDKAVETSKRALSLDPLMAEAHTSRGLALSLVGSYKEAEEAFAEAIERGPHLFEPRFQFARVLFVEGKLEEAARLYEQAHRRRPEDYQSLFLAGQAYSDLGQADRATALRRRGVVVANQHLALNPYETRALYLAANGLVALGERARGLQLVERALAVEPNEPMLLYNAGCIFVMVGNVERALDCLERSVDAGLRQRGWFEHDSNLNGIREHPRFQALLARTV